MARRPAGGQPLLAVCAKPCYWAREFNVFINDLDDGAEYTVCEFANDTDSGVDISDDCAAIQRGCIGWRNGLLGISCSLACKGLCWSKNNPRHQEVHWGKAALQKKNLGVLVVTKLKISQQCSLLTISATAS